MTSRVPGVALAMTQAPLGPFLWGEDTRVSQPCKTS